MALEITYYDYLNHMNKFEGRKVNRSGLADVFGVSLTTVDAWIRAGMPIEQRAAGKGRPARFDTADVARWREERVRLEATGQEVQDDAALSRRRKLAETRLVEIELAEKMGLIAPLDQIERAWSQLLAEVQSNLRGAFVMRCATQLIGETNERAFKRTLLAEVDSCLTALSEMDLSEEAISYEKSGDESREDTGTEATPYLC